MELKQLESTNSLPPIDNQNNDDTSQQDSGDDPGAEFWLQEYKTLSNLYQKFMELYIKCFLIYLGFLGVMLKFAFDNGSSTTLQYVFAYYGLAICGLFCILIIGAERTSVGMKKRYQEAIDYLRAPGYDYFWPTRWFSVGFVVFNFSAICVISYLLWTFGK